MRRFMLVGLALLALVGWLGTISSSSAAPTQTEPIAHLYWANESNADTIGRANLDGSNVNENFISVNEPEDVAVDAEHIYWTNYSTDAIGRANLDGTGVNQSFISPPSAVVAIAVDSNHIYWANAYSSAIGRANLDGSGVNESFLNTGSAAGIAVDARHIYWTSSSGTTIGRADLDGSNVNKSFISGANSPRGIAVYGDHLYWVNYLADTIGRANTDGSNVNQSFINPGNCPAEIAVDGLYVYWTDPCENLIGRANIDGSNVNQNFITGANVPSGIAVDADPRLELVPSSIAADGSSISTATATVTNGLGSPVAGESVSFASSDPGEQIGPVTDHDDGTYTATITASTTPGTATITATDNSVSPSLSGQATLTQTPLPATSVQVGLVPSSIAADGSSISTATATVTNGLGSPVAGESVSFASSDPGEQIGPVTDHGDGTYTATITASTTPGTATITATDNSVSPSLSGQATLTQTAVTPTVTSVSPGSGPASGGTPITITGTGFVAGATVLVGQGNGTSGAIPATNVQVVSPTQITATTGAGARPGSWNVFVANPGRTSAISPGDKFTYYPTATSVSPASGPSSGGTGITITGSGFVAGASVWVGQGNGTTGGIRATNVQVVSPSEITATTGGGAKSGSWNVFVVSSGITSPINPAATFNYFALTVTGVNPGSGPASGGTPITITGTGFAPGATVLVAQGNGTTGGIPATDVVVVSSTKITATTGGGARAGSWNVFVVSSGATSPISAGGKFSYAPTVISVSPGSGPINGGTAITITGSGFTAGSTVLIGQGNGTSGAIPATHVIVVSPTQITATTGGGARSGTWNVFVVSSGITSSISSGGKFTYS